MILACFQILGTKKGMDNFVEKINGIYTYIMFVCYNAGYLRL